MPIGRGSRDDEFDCPSDFNGRLVRMCSIGDKKQNEFRDQLITAHRSESPSPHSECPTFERSDSVPAAGLGSLLYRLVAWIARNFTGETFNAAFARVPQATFALCLDIVDRWRQSRHAYRDRRDRKSGS